MTAMVMLTHWTEHKGDKFSIYVHVNSMNSQKTRTIYSNHILQKYNRRNNNLDRKINWAGAQNAVLYGPGKCDEWTEKMKQLDAI